MGGDELDDEVVLPCRDDDVVRLVPARDLIRDRLGRTGGLHSDEGLFEAETEWIGHADDLEDVIGAETRIARPYGRLRDAELGGDAAERLPPVFLQRLDDPLVERVDPAGGADWPPAALGR